MESETDTEFVERFASYTAASIWRDDPNWVRLFTLARRGAEAGKLAAALYRAQRMSELAAEMIRDKRRTQAHGPVAAMVERIACHFDRIAKGARNALPTPPKEPTNG